MRRMLFALCDRELLDALQVEETEEWQEKFLSLVMDAIVEGEWSRSVNGGSNCARHKPLGAFVVATHVVCWSSGRELRGEGAAGKA